MINSKIAQTDVEFRSMKHLLEKYEELCFFLIHHGDVYSKKHGSWIIYQTGRIVFLMDTWNKAIEFYVMKDSTPVKNEYWVGMDPNDKEKAESKFYVGIHWGGFELKVEESWLDFQIEMMELRHPTIEKSEPKEWTGIRAARKYLAMKKFVITI